MKKLLLTIFTLMLMNTPIFIHANQVENNYKDKGFYYGTLAGINFQHYGNRHSDYETKISPGFLVGGFAGYKFFNNIRISTEFTYGRNEVKLKPRYYSFLARTYKGVERTYTLIGNAYYDFDLNSKWTPYIGLGLGYSHTTTRFKHSNEYFKKNMVVFDAICGCSYQVSSTLDLDIEYRSLFTQQNKYNHSIILSSKQFF